MTPESSGVPAPLPSPPLLGKGALQPYSPEAERKPGRVEREIHRKALAYYFLLGKDRTIAKVAKEFGLKEATALQWSAAFGWKEKIIALENRSKESEFREKAMDLLLLTLDSLVKEDKKTGKMVLISSEKSTAEKIKLAVDSYKKLRDDSREGDAGSGEGAAEGLGKRKPGVIVNVLITNEKLPLTSFKRNE